MGSVSNGTRETEILFDALRRKNEFLAGNVGGKHEAAFGDCKYRHATLVVAVGCRITWATTRFGGGAIGTHSGGGSRGDGDGAGAGAKFEFTGFEFIQVLFVLEEYYLTERFAAGLKPEAQLRHHGGADYLILHIYPTAPSSTADDEASGANGGEYCVGIAIVEKYGAFAGVLE